MSSSQTPDCGAVTTLPRAFGEPELRGRLRVLPEDFQVDEVLGFNPSGSGEHLLIQVVKRDTNTQWLAGQIGRFAGVRTRDIGYAGLKDRNAVTTQWFSVSLPGRPDPDWEGLRLEGVEVLRSVRHHRKLRRGCHRGNRFRIRVRGLEGTTESLQRRLQRIERQGIPNYFGSQRFGHDARNLEAAKALLAGTGYRATRSRRSIYLSAARAWLFNRVLARRVHNGNWNQVVAGDLLILDGRHGRFRAETPDVELERRAASLEIHPTGPLWGKAGFEVAGDALESEREALSNCGDWCDGLARLGMASERRALRAAVRGLSWRICGGELDLGFELGRGSYATAVVREILCD
jgi:tRNA pseudouridine13 synthase